MLGKNNIGKLLEMFFNNPRKEFHIRELSRMTDISAPTILLAVKELEKLKLINTHKKGNLKIAKASLSIEFFHAKRVRNLQMLYESSLVNYLSNLYENPKAIVLFGSFSRGDDVETSDIDIAVITNMEKKSDLKLFEKKFGKKISIHEINIKEISKEFYSNLINGIVVEGALHERF